MTTRTLLAAALLALAPAATTHAQTASADCAAAAASVDHATMDHAAHRATLARCAAPLPSAPGQSAYAAIGEVVRLLTADPATDWSRVNIEALRQHLIDMDEVTMHAAVTQSNVPGGVAMVVTGTGRTAAAITRMVTSHARALDAGGDYHATATALPDGARLTITTRHDADARAVTRIRGLGFAGLMTEGDHHAAHHLALARGDASHGH